MKSKEEIQKLKSDIILEMEYQKEGIYTKSYGDDPDHWDSFNEAMDVAIECVEDCFRLFYKDEVKKNG